MRFKLKIYWKIGAGLVVFGLALALLSLSVGTSKPIEVSRAATPPTTLASVIQPTATTVVVLTATSVPAALIQPEAARRGGQTFTAWCNSCHPNGQEGYGPALWGAGVNITPEIILARVRHSNQRERDRFATLSEEKLSDIIAFIQSQQHASDSNK